ncbi:MAG: Fic family protein [Gemmatimonadales bacterium]
MYSLSPAFLDAIRLSSADGSSLQALGERRGRQELFRRQTPEVLAALREAAVIESSESSNRIEGVEAPHPRIEALVLHNAAPRDRSEQEIAGYRDALNLIHESAREMGISTNVILQLHTMLYRYQAGQGGRWKAAQNEIVEREADGTVQRVRFVPPSPVATPSLMDGLETEYRRAAAGGREPLILAPLVVLDFLCVHPFADGNGRMARLLTLLLLYQFDYEVGRYISLERVVEQSKQTYYEALEASSQGWHEARHDPLPWMRYFWGVVLAAYKEFEERVGTIRTGRGSKTDLVEEAVARRIGAFAISDIEADCPGVSRDWVRLVLRRLRDEGRIVRQGRGRGSKWVRREA